MLWRRADMLEKMANVEDVWTHVQDTLHSLEISCLIYLTVDQNFDAPYILTNVPDLYMGTDAGNDPFLRHCCHSYEITLTGPAYLPRYAYLPEHAKTFIQAARKVGFETGLGIPMRLRGSDRFGGFNLGTRLPQQEFEASILPRAEELRTFCLLAHRRIEELNSAPKPQETEMGRTRMIAPHQTNLEALTPREHEVAYLIAQGFSRKECARLCGLSPNTVSDYLKAIYKKLAINNRAELARLVETQIPAPPPIQGDM